MRCGSWLWPSQTPRPCHAEALLDIEPAVVLRRRRCWPILRRQCRAPQPSGLFTRHSTQCVFDRKQIQAELTALGEFVATSNPIQVAAEIVVAFVSYNALPIGELPKLIESIYTAICGAAGLGASAATPGDEPAPAVSVRKSVTPDYLICLDDGKRYKSLRRHLTLLGMTPEQYRKKWGLPFDYPMVAPAYAARRSEMAKNFGLGRKRKEPVAVAVQAWPNAKSVVRAS